MVISKANQRVAERLNQVCEAGRDDKAREDKDDGDEEERERDGVGGGEWCPLG